MTAYRLDTDKLMRQVDIARRAGQPDEISLRQLAREIGAGSSTVFTRLRAGATPNVDALCSLIMWLDPQARLADYVVAGAARGRESREVRVPGRGFPESAHAAS